MREAATVHPTGESESDVVRLDFDRRLIRKVRQNANESGHVTMAYYQLRRLRHRGVTMSRVFCCGIVAAIFGLLQSAGPAVSASVAVTNPSFETVETVQGYPGTFGDWGADLSQIVTAENGITPLHGSRMLHFVETDINAGGTGGAQADVVQAIDMSPYAASIATGNAIFSVSSYFNRIAGDSSTDTYFRLAIRSYNQTPADYASTGGTLAATALGASDLFNSDSNPATWENLVAQLLLPTDTTFVIVFLIAVENVSDDLPNVTQLDGHYADLISAQIVGPGINEVPLPAAVWLFGAGLGVIGLLGRRKRIKA